MKDNKIFRDKIDKGLDLAFKKLVAKKKKENFSFLEGWENQKIKADDFQL